MTAAWEARALAIVADKENTAPAQQDWAESTFQCENYSCDRKDQSNVRGVATSRNLSRK